MMKLALDAAMLMLALAMLLCLLRALRGPSLPDRILALDTLYIDTLALLIVLGIRQQTQLFFEVALVIGMLGFLGTVALATYLARGDIID